MSWWRNGKAVSRPDVSALRREIEEGEGRLRHPPAIALDATRRADLLPEQVEFFDLFSWFAVTLESALDASWTVDPVDVSYVRGFDMPIFGRRFVVFYNNLEMGCVEVSPTRHVLNTQDPGVHAQVQLRHLKHLPYVDAHNFLTQIELYCGPFETLEMSSFRASGAATAALTGYLWDAMRVAATAEATIIFEHHCSGPYTLFRNSVAHWTKNQVTPVELVKWRYESKRAP